MLLMKARLGWANVFQERTAEVVKNAITKGMGIILYNNVEAGYDGIVKTNKGCYDDACSWPECGHIKHAGNECVFLKGKRRRPPIGDLHGDPRVDYGWERWSSTCAAVSPCDGTTVSKSFWSETTTATSDSAATRAKDTTTKAASGKVIGSAERCTRDVFGIKDS
jgi:hypothetical protein